VTHSVGVGAGRYDQTSSCELHRLAVCRARRGADIRFLWDLIDALPAGNLDNVEASAAEPLRLLYVEYLTRNG
jgi:hypothetical protein